MGHSGTLHSTNEENQFADVPVFDQWFFWAPAPEHEGPQRFHTLLNFIA